MAIVDFKRRFFVKGHRFMAGKQEVPDEFLDCLPSDAVVIDGKPEEPKPEAEKPAEGKAKEPKPAKGKTKEPKPFKAALYTACPKKFFNQDKSKEVEREEIVALALKDFDAEGNELDAWNEITETERRGKIQAAAAKFFGEETAVD